MTNWIEEAEKRQRLKKSIKTEEEMKLEESRKENFDRLEPFLEQFRQLVERVNKISPEERAPSYEVGFTKLEGENQFEYYGSAFIEKKGVLFSNNGKKEVRWRRINIRPTKQLGLVKVSFSEKLAPEKRGQKAETKKHKYIYKINGFSEEIIFSMLDWIVFRCTTENFLESIPDSIKPHSGNSEDKRCFIATAVYGMPDDYHLYLLRAFRDRRLMTNLPGRLFVRIYYRTSPRIARYIAANSNAKYLVRKILVEPLVKAIS
ncbi:MAG: hypothetical protein KJ607_10450 [Bacteroidetes bacterium]|nr:hypothetical protein [Bacteroidota bacterium]